MPRYLFHMHVCSKVLNTIVHHVHHCHGYHHCHSFITSSITLYIIIPITISVTIFVVGVSSTLAAVYIITTVSITAAVSIIASALNIDVAKELVSMTAS